MVGIGGQIWMFGSHVGDGIPPSATTVVDRAPSKASRRTVRRTSFFTWHLLQLEVNDCAITLPGKEMGAGENGSLLRFRKLEQQ